MIDSLRLKSSLGRARFLVLTILGWVWLLGGCGGLGNNAVATYQKIGDRYLIEVTGRRAGWSHDLSRRESYTDRWTFDVPRINGKIDGKEILQRPGYYPYVGAITIADKKMVVSLSADNYDFRRLEFVEWNGRYTLVEKTDTGPKAGPEKKP
ncbi:MAG: hypothetical protein JNK23_13185 [Opitutaceae bacterium]|nr:hypothetical protein [Opitutaceae bacterium]